MKRWIKIAALIAFANGCGNPYEDICNELADCMGSNEADVAACVVEAEADAEEAAAFGCEDAYDQYITCIQDKGPECKDGGDDYSFDACDDVEERWHDCEEKASVRLGG